MNNIYIFILGAAIFLTVIEMSAQYNLKKFNITDNYEFYIIGILLYVITATIFTKLLSYEKIGIVNHLWNIFSSLLGFLMGWMFFSEALTFSEMLGVVLSMLGIILMGVKLY